MKHLILRLFCIGFVLSVMVLSACSNDDDLVSVVKPSAEGTMTDKEGNAYPWVRIGNQDWMAENLHSGTPFYDLQVNTTGGAGNVVWISDLNQAKAWLKDFGNYYNYQQALDNCPAGWRLPSDDDWKQLERNLGMSASAVNAVGWRNGASKLMLETSAQGTGLYFKFGGELCKWGYISQTDSTVKPYRQYEIGMYWTSTKDTTKAIECAYYRKIMNGLDKVERHSTTTVLHYLSVRYVRDAQK